MNIIKACKCDLCFKYNEGVECYVNGTPVLFTCRICSPNLFAQTSNMNASERERANKQYLNSLN